MALRNFIVSNILLSFLIASCNNGQLKSKELVSKVDVVITTDSNQPKSYFDQVEVRKYPKDTLLESGWNIHYFVKNDSSRSSDLYINCSKNGQNHIYQSQDVLLLRSFFIPTFIGESKNCIYFSTACGTNCNSLLVFNKKFGYSYKVYNSIVNYNINEDIVVYIREDFEYGDNFIVSIVNLRMNKYKTVRFKNYCNVLPKSDCIDSVVIIGQCVNLYGRLNVGRDFYRDKVVNEIKTIQF